MIGDAQMLLSDAQPITVDVASENTYDSGNAARDIFAGEPMGLMFAIDVAAASDSAGTYEFQCIQSANANLSSPDILVKTDTTFTNEAALSAGSLHELPVPGGLKTKQYIGAYYNVGGTNPTVTVTCWIMPLSFIRRLKNYANGYTISH